jgi:hypothetical protein
MFQSILLMRVVLGYSLAPANLMGLKTTANLPKVGEVKKGMRYLSLLVSVVVGRVELI